MIPVNWFVLVLLVQIVGCSSPCSGTAKEEFACELEEKTDALISRMGDARGLTNTTWSGIINGKFVESDLEVPKMGLIAAHALAITDHISRVHPSMIEELSKADSKAWQAEMRELFREQRARIVAATEDFEKEVRLSPDSFSRSTDYYAAVTDPFIYGDYFGWSEDDEFYVRMLYTGDVVFVGRTLSVDMDEWLTSILSNLNE